MGLLVGDEYVLENGVTMTNYYVYIDGVNIMKSPTRGTYGISCDVRTYASREMRDAGKEVIEVKRFGISGSDLTDIHTQLYNRLKQNYTNVSDVFESEQTETTEAVTETSNTETVTETTEAVTETSNTETVTETSSN
jgi:hypothetical protein